MRNKLFINFAFAAALMFSAAGCEKLTSKHQIVRAGEQTFLLEQSSGVVKLIQGTAIIPIKVVGELSTDARVWPEHNIPNLGDVRLSIQTKYRDGKMLYIVAANPFKGTLAKAWAGTSYAVSPTLFLDLMDRDQFRIGETITLSLGDATRIVDAQDEVMGLPWTGSQPMSIDAYQDASQPSVRWAGFDQFIEHKK